MCGCDVVEVEDKQHLLERTTRLQAVHLMIIYKGIGRGGVCNSNMGLVIIIYKEGRYRSLQAVQLALTVIISRSERQKDNTVPLRN
jgi:hypothetical protein